MAIRTYLLWLLLALLSGAIFAQTPPAQIKWAPDLATAKQASAQFKVPLMIHFYGDSCVPCRTLENNVFTNPEVIQVLNKFFICVSINGSRDSKAMAEYGVHSYPTDVFLSPSGDNLYQGVSPQDVRNYLSTLERVAVMNRDRNLLAAAKKENSTSTIAQQAMTTAGQLVSASSSGSGLPGLPPPGFADPSHSNQSGFYQAEGAQASQQQLPLGAASSSSVQTGPLLGNQQPISIAGSVPPPQAPPTLQQRGSMPILNSATQRGGSESAGLPFPPLGGPGSGSQLPQLANQSGGSMTNYAQLASTSNVHAPTIPAVTASTPTSNKTSATPWNGGMSNFNATIDNPHFQLASQPNSSAPTNSGLATNSGATTGHGSTLAATPTHSAAIDGYCPVSLRAKQWKKGDPQYAVKHRGLLFNMADAACQEEFLRNPDFYSPILLCHDPLVLLNQGRLVPGSTQHGLFEDKFGALFFESAENKAEFHRNFVSNMEKIEKLAEILQRSAQR